MPELVNGFTSPHGGGETRWRSIARLGTIAGLAAILAFALGSAAWASTGFNGPTPPKIADPVDPDVAPHGGYSSSSNFCLQCHDVHDADGEYALLWKSSVTDTCATCHGYMGNAETGTRDPLGTGTIGTASVRTVYDSAAPGSEHGIGSANSPDGVTMMEGEWSYGWTSGGPASGTADSDTPAGAGTAAAGSGGLYCGSCHTPHGESGQAINTKKVWTRTSSTGAQTLMNWANDTPIWAGGGSVKYLWLDAGQWKLCTSTGGGAPCTDATVVDSEGQTVYLYGYKLLSMYPNFSYGTPRSWNADYRGRDAVSWCGECHPDRVDAAFGGTPHNHPTSCTACHGNPNADTTSKDFPHTSTVGDLLKDYPDALCVTCHLSNRSLP